MIAHVFRRFGHLELLPVYCSDQRRRVIFIKPRPHEHCRRVRRVQLHARGNTLPSLCVTPQRAGQHHVKVFAIRPKVLAKTLALPLSEVAEIVVVRRAKRRLPVPY